MERPASNRMKTPHAFARSSNVWGTRALDSYIGKSDWYDQPFLRHSFLGTMELAPLPYRRSNGATPITEDLAILGAATQVEAVEFIE